MEGPPGVAPPMPMPMMAAPRKTPIGVAVLGVLTLLIGIGTLGIGALIALGSGVLAIGGGPLGGALGAFGAVIGGVIAIFGLIAILTGVGLIRLRGWAWWLTMIIGVLSLLGGLASGLWPLAAIWLLIVVYLIVVKKEFGAQPGAM